jgi:ABC-type molybdate transport system ATPase subunit
MRFRIRSHRQTIIRPPARPRRAAAHSLRNRHETQRAQSAQRQDRGREEGCHDIPCPARNRARPVVTSSITNEAVDELGLKVGGTATAIIKASSVMIAVD